LFVRLVNLPKNIHIPDLPENVVPLVRTMNLITCLLSDDTLLSVLREQVVCLMNFGMTDYTSQGKLRPNNPVEMAHCSDHRAYYVALSRRYTAEGTLILRELEVLDEITRQIRWKTS
ncbi:hypothetical protein B0H19DRAFT_969722, partial [Mycena capillaripes]